MRVKSANNARGPAFSAGPLICFRPPGGGSMAWIQLGLVAILPWLDAGEYVALPANLTQYPVHPFTFA